MKKNIQIMAMLTVLVALILASCQPPLTNISTVNRGTITVSFGTASRSVVPNWDSQVTVYSITLISKNRFPTQYGVASKAGVVTFSSISPGIWNVNVIVSGRSGTIASGSANDQILTAGGSLAVSITLYPTQSKTGSYRFAFVFPGSTGIDYVSGQLFDLNGNPVGTKTEATLSASGQNLAGAFSANQIASGIYRLAMTFKRGGGSGIDAGSYSEAVTIFDNAISDQWLGTDGILHSQRTFSESDFNSSNANLADLLIHSGTTTLALSPFFSSLIINYQVRSSSNLTITPTQSLAGQRIEYRLNSGYWTSILSGAASSPLNVDALSIIEIRVTATDRTTQKTYTLTATDSGGTITYDGNGSDGGNVPEDNNNYPENAITTVMDNTGNMVRTGYIFCGWNTAGDASGTYYYPHDTLTIENRNLTLYAVWADNATLSISTDKTVIQGSTKPSGILMIPYGVNYIRSFAGCAGLTRVLFPNTVIGIFADTFRNCTNLNNITLPLSLQDIGAEAFANCDSLGSITIPASVTSINGNVFTGCDNLCQINVDPGNAFYKSIDGVLFRKDGTTLYAYPAGGMTSYTIPEGVTMIYPRAFGDCSALINVNFATSIKYIENNAFSGCTKLNNVIIPYGVTSIKQSAFEDCTSLSNIVLPSSITSIDGIAFRSCTNLSSITIPPSVISIGFDAFTYCNSLTSITIPAGVTNITSNAFHSCSNLKQIVVEATNTAFQSLDGVLYDKNATTLIAYPTGGAENYNIPNGVSVIGSSAFYECRNLKSVTIPVGVTSISPGAFEGCSNLTSITFPEGLTSIGQSAFRYCFMLTGITLPASVTSIGESAFSYCSPDRITIPLNVTFIGDAVFNGCEELFLVICEPISPPAFSGFWAFAGCDSTLKIKVPAGSVNAYQTAPGWKEYADKIIAQ